MIKLLKRGNGGIKRLTCQKMMLGNDLFTQIVMMFIEVSIYAYFIGILKMRIRFGDLRCLTIFVETKTETMNKLRQLLFDFTNVGEWRIVVWAKNIAWKIKDYDRLNLRL